MRTKPEDEPGWELCQGVDADGTWGPKLNQPNLQVHRDSGWGGSNASAEYSVIMWYRRRLVAPEMEHFI